MRTSRIAAAAMLLLTAALPAAALICGDGILDGGEQCDDGNLIPFDGCSTLCTNEV